MDEISGWVGCRQQLPVLKLTQLNLETTKRQTKPFIMPWGGARVSKRYMVVQKAQKQQNCELTQSSSVASGQGLWEAYLPGTREGCHSKEEVLHRYRGLHVYSYIGVKRPWDMQRPKVSLFCVLIKWHGNTCRCWKGWKDSVQATQNLPKNHFFYPNPWMCFISDQLHATFKNLTSQNRISIKAMHECAPSQALKVEYPGTAHMSPLRYSL